MQWFLVRFLLIGYWLLLNSLPRPVSNGRLNGTPVILRHILIVSFYPVNSQEGSMIRLVSFALFGICNVLLGIFTGLQLKSDKTTPVAKVKWMIIAGVVSIALSVLWNLDFPIIKPLVKFLCIAHRGLSLLLYRFSTISLM